MFRYLAWRFTIGLLAMAFIPVGLLFTAAASTPKSNIESSNESLEATQKWLKSLRLKYTLEQVKPLRLLKLQLYGNINGVSSQILISNQKLTHLKNLPNIEILSLPVWTNDKGFENIAGLIKLKQLIIPQTNITDSALKLLKNKLELQHLVLAGSKISDKGLANLAGLTKMEILNLNSTQVSTAGFKQLANLKNLQQLYILNTNIKDDAVPLIVTFKNLKRLDVGDNISKANKAKINQAIRGIKIH